MNSNNTSKVPFYAIALKGKDGIKEHISERSLLAQPSADV